MKKNFLYILAIVVVMMGGTSFVACDFGGTTTPDYNADIQEIAPEDIKTEHFVAEEGKTYYTSPGFSLMMEVNGAFLEMDYFTLEGNKRIYDNLYFYEKDYFYIITSDYKDLYASLGDSADLEYAEEEKEQGYDIQINVKKAGIYKLIFDVDTLKFDMEYKAEITTPVYYTIPNCSIYSLATNWVEMSVNTANADEFVIHNYHIGVNEFISFHDRTHVSLYKVSMDENCNEKYASYKYPTVMVNVGGNYDIYINAKTYVVRMELLNPDTAAYSCVYYDGTDFITLAPYEEAVAYLFRQRIVVEDANERLPDFHTEKYRTYDLTVVDEAGFLKSVGSSYYFKKAGTYDVIVNLKTFEITVELLPE